MSFFSLQTVCLKPRLAKLGRMIEFHPEALARNESQWGTRIYTLIGLTRPPRAARKFTVQTIV